MSDLIEVYAKRLKAVGRSPYTISTRCRVLRHAHRLMPRGLDKAHPDDIVEYLARLDEGTWTQTTIYSHLHGYYKTMVMAGRLPVDPTVHVGRPKSGPRIPTPVEDWELAVAIDRSPDQPWRTAAILGAYAGLRCCELCVLDRDDVTKDHVHVQRGKGGEGRYVPTHPIVWDLVNGRPSGPLITTKTGQPIRPEHLSSAQRVHWGRIGLGSRVKMHGFRHWFGTTMAENGIGIEVICQLMGHKSIEQTRCYIRVSAARRNAAMAALPVMGGNEHQPGDSRLVPTAA
jgi:site-specific recombinase XerD